MRTILDLSTSPPAARTSPYTHTGIGGAGNVRPILPPSSLTRLSSSSTTTTTTTTTHSRPTSTSRFSTGRGGAGNMPRPGVYRAMFAFDEEAQLQRRVRPAPVTYHTGRGGEGNTVHLGGRRGSLESDGSENGTKSEADKDEKKEREGGKRGSLEVAKEWLKRW